jgi:hypothetical protein
MYCSHMQSPLSVTINAGYLSSVRKEKKTQTGCVAQVVEYLPSKCQALITSIDMCKATYYI